MIKTLTFVPQVEKDNACDRVDASEEQCKAARVNICSPILRFTEAGMEIKFGIQYMSYAAEGFQG